MTAQKLYGTLKFLDAIDTKFGLQTSLEAVRDSLTALASAPAQPAQQTALAAAKATFEAAAEKLKDLITPSQAGSIAELGGSEFFDPGLADKVRIAIESNAMTPSVARDFVQDIAVRRATFLETVRATIQGLGKLSVTPPALPAGAADIAFLIPRDLFENNVGDFAKELIFIDRLIRHITEGLTGESEPVELGSLSSSIPTITLGASLAAIVTLATIVNKFLEAWERIQKFRKLRDELIEVGMKGTAVNELSEQVTTVIEEIVEESTQVVFAAYTGTDEGIKNERQNGVRADVRRLFGQIERGLTIEFRAEPKGAEENNKVALNTITDIGRHMKFPAPSKEPLLLSSGEVLEGDIQAVRHTKTTTTKKTTTSKKETKPVKES
jgi:hypothetical protein